MKINATVVGVEITELYHTVKDYNYHAVTLQLHGDRTSRMTIYLPPHKTKPYTLGRRVSVSVDL